MGCHLPFSPDLNIYFCWLKMWIGLGRIVLYFCICIHIYICLFVYLGICVFAYLHLRNIGVVVSRSGEGKAVGLGRIGTSLKPQKVLSLFDDDVESIGYSISSWSCLCPLLHVIQYFDHKFCALSVVKMLSNKM